MSFKRMKYPLEKFMIRCFANKLALTGGSIVVSIVASIVAAITTLGIAPSAFATDRAYNFGSIAYSNTDGLDGFSGSGSFEVGNNFRIIGGGSLVSTEGFNLRTFTLGAGYIARLSSSTDLLIDAGFLNVENQFLFVGTGDDEWGGFGGLSLRFAAGENVDIEPSLTYVNLFDIEFGDNDQFVYGITARFWVGSRFAIEVGVSDSEDAIDPTLSIGMRFGRKKR